jgi:hypothetical protein
MEVVGAIVESHTAKTAKITAAIFLLLNMILMVLIYYHQTM